MFTKGKYKMNTQKLKDIAMQAKISMMETDPDDRFFELFAELIIRECAGLAHEGTSGILDHFGIS
jgi:hypothetical protein